MAIDLDKARKRRHKRIRKKISGTSERPRLSVHKSLNHIYAQIIDDFSKNTLVFVSSLDKGLKAEKTHKGNIETAKKIGKMIAQKALDKGIKKIVFDRGGYIYHGRVKAVAESARESGLEF